jgi:hypothetical protein
VVECDLAKVEVAGSNPVSRSNFHHAPAPSLSLLLSRLPGPGPRRALSSPFRLLTRRPHASHPHQKFSRVASSHARGAVAKW